MTTFGPLFVAASFRDAVSDDAWLDAMLDAERALAEVDDDLPPEERVRLALKRAA